MITKDYLPNHPEIELYQDDTMLRINTDTYVLGELLNIYRNDTVLDWEQIRMHYYYMLIYFTQRN